MWNHDYFGRPCASYAVLKSTPMRALVVKMQCDVTFAIVSTNRSIHGGNVLQHARIFVLPPPHFLSRHNFMGTNNAYLTMILFKKPRHVIIHCVRCSHSAWPNAAIRCWSHFMLKQLNLLYSRLYNKFTTNQSNGVSALF